MFTCNSMQSRMFSVTSQSNFRLQREQLLNMKLSKLFCCFYPPVPPEEGEVDDMARPRAQAVGKRGKTNPSKKKMRKEAKRIKHEKNDMKKKEEEIKMKMDKPMVMEQEKEDGASGIMPAVDMMGPAVDLSSADPVTLSGQLAKDAADESSKALQQPTTPPNLTTGAEEPVERVTRETIQDHGETDGASSVSSSISPCDLLATLNSVAKADGDIVALLDHLKAANMRHMAMESRPGLRQPEGRVNLDMESPMGGKPALRQPTARLRLDTGPEKLTPMESRPRLRQPAGRVNLDMESPIGGKPALRQPTARLRLDSGPEKLIPKETLHDPQADGSTVNGGQCSTPAVDAPHSAVTEAVIAHPCLSTDTADVSGSGDLQQPEMGLAAIVTGEMSAGGGQEDEADEQD
ncbi:uncharacterized protein LOC134452140 [Engraulis encrasicolus]|uniref:uncharacterized protein LOC134452140 n=1 Tax=Engraulis encrasicolus TaxID=184585 RepID=UPI002FD66C57